MSVRAHDDPKNPDYTKTPFAWWLSNGAAIIEFTNCFLLFGNNWYIHCVWRLEARPYNHPIRHPKMMATPASKQAR